jgi:hypothetical protein
LRERDEQIPKASFRKTTAKEQAVSQILLSFISFLCESEGSQVKQYYQIQHFLTIS